jgi:Na+-transporting methylmalonyl-CoA/oxaloacetate decarboxylase gamma subunit
MSNPTPNEEVAPAFIKMVRVPVWVVRVTSGLLIIMGAGAVAACLVFFLVLLWCIGAIVNQNKRIERLTTEFRKEAKSASIERDRVIESVENVQKAVEPMIPKGDQK